MPAPPQIDLSAGLVPAQTPSPAQPAAAPPGIDLSAGLVASGPANPTNPNPPSSAPPNAADWRTQGKQAAAQLVDQNTGQAKGFLKSAADTAYHIGRLIVPDRMAEALGGKPVTDEYLNAHLKPSNDAEQSGAFAENLAEFLMGDEALKGLGLADKLKAIAPALKAIEKFPSLAAAIQTGLRQGAVATAQGVAHGADLPTAATEGAIVGATGGALEGGVTKVAGTMAKVAPDTTKIAGEEIPRLASQKPNPTRAAVRAASIGDEPELARTQQQGAQRAVHNIARQGAEDALNRLNDARQPTTERTTIATRGPGAPAVEGADTIPEGIAQEGARRDLGSTAATVPDRMMARNPIVSKVGTEAANIHPSVLDEKPQTPRTVQVENEKAPNFEPVDAQASAANVHSFDDAAKAIEAPAQQVYQKLDKLSKGEFTALREQRKAALDVMREPGSVGAYKKAKVALREADDGIDNLFEQHRGEINRGDWMSANSAWRDAKVFDEIHAAVESSFNAVPEDVAQRTGINRDLRGDSLRNNLGKLLSENGDDVQRVIGTQGIDTLYRLADLLKSPESAAKTGVVMRTLGRYFEHTRGAGAVLGAAAGYAMGGHAIGGGLAGALAEATMDKVLNAAAVNPRVGKMIADAVKLGANPRVYAPLIAAEIRKNSDDTMAAVSAARSKMPGGQN